MTLYFHFSKHWRFTIFVRKVNNNLFQEADFELAQINNVIILTCSIRIILSSHTIFVRLKYVRTNAYLKPKEASAFKTD